MDFYSSVCIIHTSIIECVNAHSHTYLVHVRTYCSCIYMYIHVHVLMRDEKEGRKKQARSNKQGNATQHTHGSSQENELPQV